MFGGGGGEGWVGNIIIVFFLSCSLDALHTPRKGERIVAILSRVTCTVLRGCTYWFDLH